MFGLGEFRQRRLYEPSFIPGKNKFRSSSSFHFFRAEGVFLMFSCIHIGTHSGARAGGDENITFY